MDQFLAANAEAVWHDVSYMSGLDDVGISYAVKSSQLPTSTVSGDGSIFPDNSTRAFISSEITGLSDADLRIAINEIYARHGYIFESQDLLDHFRQFDGYHETVPKNSWNDSMFSSIEKQNVNLLSAERSRR